MSSLLSFLLFGSKHSSQPCAPHINLPRFLEELPASPAPGGSAGLLHLPLVEVEPSVPGGHHWTCSGFLGGWSSEPRLVLIGHLMGILGTLQIAKVRAGFSGTPVLLGSLLESFIRVYFQNPNHE